jgi:hypothetical protein
MSEIACMHGTIKEKKTTIVLLSYDLLHPCVRCIKEIWQIGKVGKVGKVGEVGKVGREGLFMPTWSQL